MVSAKREKKQEDVISITSWSWLWEGGKEGGTPLQKKGSQGKTSLLKGHLTETEWREDSNISNWDNNIPRRTSKCKCPKEGTNLVYWGKERSPVVWTILQERIRLEKEAGVRSQRPLLTRTKGNRKVVQSLKQEVTWCDNMFFKRAIWMLTREWADYG